MQHDGGFATRREDIGRAYARGEERLVSIALPQRGWHRTMVSALIAHKHADAEHVHSHTRSHTRSSDPSRISTSCTHRETSQVEGQASGQHTIVVSVIRTRVLDVSSTHRASASGPSSSSTALAFRRCGRAPLGRSGGGARVGCHHLGYTID